MPMKRPLSTQAGMTLVEILAVVVILGLIAGTLVVSFSGSFGEAKHEIAKTGIAQIAEKLEIYRMKHGEWPGAELGLEALTDGNASPTDSYYLEPDKLLDPWNEPYYFLTPGPGELPYEIVSYGSDRQAGGDGEAADISSANLKGVDR
ncbi:MAG: type II secretion system major pseudopilin GspG [Planctomycetota bacterium]